MWYEILPLSTIIITLSAMPAVGLYVSHHLVIGNFYQRSFGRLFDRSCYRRDRRIQDNPYLMKGLDPIPDEE